MASFFALYLFTQIEPRAGRVSQSLTPGLAVGSSANPLLIAGILLLLVLAGFAIRFAIAWQYAQNNKRLIQAAESGEAIDLGEGRSAHVDLFLAHRVEEPEEVAQLLKTRLQVR